MTHSSKATKAMIIIVILTLANKFLGFFRDVLIASKFGSGMVTDAYFIALTAVGLIISFFSTAINTTLIPILSEIESLEGKEGKRAHTNNIVSVIFILSVLIVLIGVIFAPIIVRLLAQGFEGDLFNYTVKLTRIVFPRLLFVGIVGVFTAYLQSEEIFTSSYSMEIPYNLIQIIFLLFLAGKFGMEGLMIATVLAVSSRLFILIPGLRESGYKYEFKFDLKDKYISKILFLSLPIFIGVAINDLNAIIDKTIASNLVEGSISALNYSAKLNNIILGVFIAAITTVIFPLLSKEANNYNIDGVKSTMGYGINLILLITVPATVGLIVLATPIVEIAFQRGEFDVTATLMTSQALIFYSIGLVAMALRLLLIRVYYSLQDTKTPMINGAISVGLNIIFNLILVKFMAHAGLALATSIATTIATIMLLYGLKKKIGSLGTKEYIITFLKSCIASTVMGVVAYSSYLGLYSALGVSKLNNLTSLLVAVGLAVIVYGVLCYLFKIEEVRDIVDKVKNRLLKR